MFAKMKGEKYKNNYNKSIYLDNKRFLFQTCAFHLKIKQELIVNVKSNFEFTDNVLNYC